MKKLLPILILLLTILSQSVISQDKILPDKSLAITDSLNLILQNSHSGFRQFPAFQLTGNINLLNSDHTTSQNESDALSMEGNVNDESIYYGQIAMDYFKSGNLNAGIKAGTDEDLGIYACKYDEENTSGNTLFGSAVANAGDFNGDGYDDFMISAPNYKFNTGRVYIYFGSYEPNAIADLILDGENTGDMFGYSIARAGDVNKDGFSDIIIGAYGYRNYTGKAYVFFGAANPDNIPDMHLDGEISGDFFGYSVSTAGDVNNDGFDDVLIGSPYSGYNQRGKSYIYLGGGFADNTEDIVLFGQIDYQYFGNSVSTAGDFNRDGFDDVIIATNSYNAGKAYIYYGGSFMDNASDLTLEGSVNTSFGYTVSNAGDVNGDGYDDVIVGAISFNNGIGQALIFYGGYTPNNNADITLSGKNQSVYFGYSVSSAGDVNYDGYDDVVVGTYIDGNYGKAYIFLGKWIMDPDADIEITGETNSSNFGQKVSFAGDVNNDGYGDIIIGANGFDYSTGKAYLYYGNYVMDNNSDLSIKGENTLNQFAYSVSEAGDVNNDGFDDIIIGAPSYNKNTGRAYIYFGGVLADHIADVILNGEGTGSSFGLTVSCAGDINNDGYSDVMVGAYSYNNYTGAVYIYFGGPNMDNITDLRVIGEATYNYFGFSASDAGDLNGDGFDDFVVGASGFNNGSGKAYVFYGSKYPDNTPDLIINGEIAGSSFGRAVSNAGDVNKDGYDDILVSATNFGSSTGKVYLYYGSYSPDNISDIVYNGENTGNQFGWSLSSAGDFNKDGYDDIVVGAPYANSSIGKVYLFLGGSIKDNVADITFNGESSGNIFGSSVKYAGDINNDGYGDIIIGSYNYNNNKGRAYAYYGSETLNNSVGLVLNPLTQYPEYFGYSVSGAGDVNNDGLDDLIIGAYNCPTNGVAYLYQGLSAPEITVQPANTNICQNNDGYLWLTVAGSGNISYQWQVNKGNSFENISDNAQFEGTNTNRLNISATNIEMNGYSFRCLINSNIGSIVSGTAILTVNQPGTVAHAGYSQYVCGNSTILNGNVPSMGTGKWSSSGNAVFTNPNQYNTEVSNLEYGENKLTWEISNGACSSQDMVTITSYEEVEANAGEDLSLCDADEYRLSGNNPEPGSGIWSAINPDIYFDNVETFNTMVYNLPIGTSVLIWTLSNGLCQSQDQIEISSNTSVKIIQQPKISPLRSDEIQIDIEVEGDVMMYQWKKDGVNLSDDENISGTNTNKLVISNLYARLYGKYSCQVTGHCNQLLTNEVNVANKSIAASFSENGILVYPNPAKDFVSFEFENYENVKDLEIFNLNSKKLVSKQHVNAIESIDLRDFDEGIYIISVREGDEIKRKLFVIQK